MANADVAPSLPAVWCDFNACGWSGEPDDTCFYILDRNALAALRAGSGTRIFIYMENDVAGQQIVGCAATLEWYGDGWRVRPDGTNSYGGPRYW